MSKLVSEKTGAVIDNYQRLSFHNTGDDNGYAFIRTELVGELARQSGFPDVLIAESAVVFVNGKYQGVYWLNNTFDDRYFQEKYGDKFSLQLMKEPMIMRTEQSGTKQEAERLLQQLGLTEQDLNIVASMNDAEALRNCIIHGLGISIVSHRMVQEQERQGSLLIYKIDQYVTPRKFYLVYQDGPYLPKAADTFIRHLRHLSANMSL